MPYHCIVKHAQPAMRTKPKQIADLDAEGILKTHRRFVARSLVGVVALILLMVVPLLVFVVSR